MIPSAHLSFSLTNLVNAAEAYSILADAFLHVFRGRLKVEAQGLAEQHLYLLPEADLFPTSFRLLE